MSPRAPAASWTIERSKVVDYLLNDAHRDGASKAKYLRAFGFTRDRPDQLAAALAEHAVACGPGREVRPPIGSPRLVIEGPLPAPDGRAANVRTVWELTSGTEARLVTLVPLTR